MRNKVVRIVIRRRVTCLPVFESQGFSEKLCNMGYPKLNARDDTLG